MQSLAETAEIQRNKLEAQLLFAQMRRHFFPAVRRLTQTLADIGNSFRNAETIRELQTWYPGVHGEVCRCQACAIGYRIVENASRALQRQSLN